MAFMLTQLLQWAVPALPLWACYGILGFVLLMPARACFTRASCCSTHSPRCRKESLQALKEDVQWIANRK